LNPMIRQGPTTQSDPPPRSPRPRLRRDLLVIVAGLVLFWFTLGGLAAGGCVALRLYVGGRVGFTALDIIAFLVMGRALGDFSCGVVLGRFLRRISPWLLLPFMAAFHGFMLTAAFDGEWPGEMPHLPLPLVPAVLVSILATGAGIKLGRHYRGLADMRRQDPELKRPWFQFRLRTLMLFFLLCSLLLGSWHALLEPFRRRARLIATIEQRWGSVSIEFTGPAWVSRLFGEQYVGNVVEIGVFRSSSPVELTEDEIIEILEETPQLRELSLCETQITDAGLARLPELPKLEYLSLMDTKFSGAGLARLKAYPSLNNLDLRYSQVAEKNLLHLESLEGLQTLSLNGPQVGDKGLSHLKPLRKLSCLMLENTQITDAGLVHLREMHDLEVLDLSHTQIRGDGFVHLAKLKRLRYLDLARTQITDTALVHLGRLCGLEELGLWGTQINGLGLIHLGALKKLEELDLGDTDVDDGGLANLAALTGLKVLLLDNTLVTDAGAKHLATMPNLERLSLRNTQITDAGLMELKDVPNLRRESLEGSRVTEEGWQNFYSTLPDANAYSRGATGVPRE